MIKKFQGNIKDILENFDYVTYEQKMELNQ